MDGLRVAAIAANKSKLHFKHGAALYLGGSLQAFGWNKERRTARFCDGPCTIHAEADCLRGVSKPARGTMFVVRIDKNGMWRMSRPCNNCMAMLRDYELKRIFYSDDEGGVKSERL